MDARIWAHLWQRPRTHREVLTDRRVSFLELFYDLIYVVLIARVAEYLHGAITGEKLATFVILFGLLWIGWYNGTLLHDAHGRPDMRNRALTFLQMFAIAAMAVFAPTADGDGGTGFAVSYLVFLILLTAQWASVTNTERDDPLYGPIALRYTRMMALMTVWTAASIFASPSIRLWMWAAFVAQFVIGMVIMGLRSGSPASGEAMGSESLLERFGLFVIIVLGEVVAGVVNGIGSVHDLTTSVFLTGFAGLAVAIALWWTYFDLVAMRPVREQFRARILSNIGQLPLAMAIAGVGGATVSLIEHTGHPDSAASWTFSGFLCLAIVSIDFLAWQLRDRAALAEMIRPALIFSVPVVALALVLPLTHPSGLVLASLLVIAMAVQWFFAIRGWWRTAEGQAKLQAVLTVDPAEARV